MGCNSSKSSSSSKDASFTDVNAASNDQKSSNNQDEKKADDNKQLQSTNNATNTTTNATTAAATTTTSSSSSSSSSSPAAAGAAPAPAPSEPKRLDPKDFMCIKLKNQTIVKEPGSIQGQQFIIEECEDCVIYLLDHSACISIDECKNCKFFIGPCQPVIEDSRDISFGGFLYNYFGLASQFEAAGLDVFNTEWSNVHDFHAAQGLHWSYLCEGDIPSLLPPLPADSATAASASSAMPKDKEGWCVPYTTGLRPALPATRGLVVTSTPTLAYDCIAAIYAKSDVMSLVRTRRVKWQKENNKIKRLVGGSELEKAGKSSPLIVLDVAGPSTLSADLSSLFAALDAKQFLVTDGQDKIDMVFEMAVM